MQGRHTLNVQIKLAAVPGFLVHCISFIKWHLMYRVRGYVSVLAMAGGQDGTLLMNLEECLTALITRFGVAASVSACHTMIFAGICQP